MTARSRGATFGKPDATGRSSGRLSRAERKLLGPPDGVPWAWQSTELLASAAWRGAPINCRKLIDFLLIEHGNHAGRENGRLKAPYNYLKAFGISRPQIKPAIDEAVRRGLVEVTETGGLHGIERKRTLSTYRLTWIGCLNPAREPTNEWRTFVEKHFTGAPRTAPDEQNRVHPVLHPTKTGHKENGGFPTSSSGAPRTAQLSRYLQGEERINDGRRLAVAMVKAEAARDAYLAWWCWLVVLSHAQERRAEPIAAGYFQRTSGGARGRSNSYPRRLETVAAARPITPGNGSVPITISPNERSSPLTLSSEDILAANDSRLVENMVAAWNETAGRCGLSIVQKLTDKRRRAALKRLGEVGGLEGWRVALEKLEASAFLKGENHNGWRADFDFVLREDKLTRLMEGAYDASLPSRPRKEPGRDDLREAVARRRDPLFPEGEDR